MADELARLKVVLLAETARYQKSLDDANRKLDRFQRQQTRSLDKIRSGFGAAAIAAAGLAAAAGMKQFVTRSADAADAANKLSDRIGVSVEGLTRLQYAAEYTGVNARELANGLQRMTRRVAQAADGTGEAVGVLQDLGISAKEFAKLRPEQQFRVLADRLDSVESAGTKAAYAQKLFDSEGVKLIQTMKGGSKALDDYADKADKAGYTLSQSAADGASKFNDSLTAGKTALTGLGRRIFQKLLPSLAKLSNWFTKLTTDSQFLYMATESIDAIFKSLATVAITVATAFKVVGSRIAAVAAAAVSAAKGEFTEAKNIIIASNEDVVASTKLAVEQVKALWSDVGEVDGPKLKPQSSDQVPESVFRTGGDPGTKAAGKSAEAAAKAAKAAEDRVRSELESVRQGLLTQEQVLLESYVRRKAVVERANNEALISESTKNKLLLGLQRQYEAARVKLAEELNPLKDRATEELASLQNSLMTQEEAIRASYERRNKIIEDATKQGVGTTDGRAELRKRSEARQEKELSDLAIEQMERRVEGAQQMFGNLAFLANNENKKLAALGRASAIVQATIDGALAAQKALAQGGPFLGPALAATIGVMTAANIATIAGARATGGPVSGGKTYLVGERGPELFTASNSGSITPNNKLGGDVNVTIIEDKSRAGRVEKDGNNVQVFVAAAMTELERQISSGRGVAGTMERRYGLNRRAV